MNRNEKPVSKKKYPIDFFIYDHTLNGGINTMCDVIKKKSKYVDISNIYLIETILQNCARIISVEVH